MKEVTTPYLMIACFLAHMFFSSCHANKDTSKSASIYQQKDTSLNGLYSGLEEMCRTDSTGKKDCYYDPARPKRKWYYLGDLKIRDDSVFLDQSPISIYKEDTSYSVSDGGFYYYSGTLQKNDTTIVFNLTELSCDYCGVPVKLKSDGTYETIKRKKQLTGKLTNKGILINGYLFARTTHKEDLISDQSGSY